MTSAPWTPCNAPVGLLLGVFRGSGSRGTRADLGVRPTALAAALFAFFWWYAPPAEPAFHLCPFYWLTARPCPLCGITRAFCALAKGHFGQAIHFHALSPLAFVMLFSLFWKWRWRTQLWTWGLAAIAIYGAVRAALA